MCYAAKITNAMIDDINENCNKVFQYYGYTYRNVIQYNASIGYSPGLAKMCIGITTSDSPVNPNYLYIFYPAEEPMGLSGNYYSTWFYVIVNLSNGNLSFPSGNSIDKRIRWKYVYSEFNWSSSTGYNFTSGEEYGATILTVPPFSFITDLVSVTYNGLSSYVLPFSYNETLSYLGTLEGIPEGTNYIGVSFGGVASYGIVLRDIKNLYTNENSSTNLIIDDNNNIYVRNRYLNYNTQYSLFVDCYSDSTYEVVTGSITTYIVAVAPGTQVSGGIITSLGSGEPYSNQNSTNDTIDFYTDYSEVNGELDSFFSGDTNEIVSNLNFPNLENNYFVVIYNVVSGISDTLRMSGDPYFDLSLHGETPKRIYASDFTTPPSLLKTFISMSLVFGTMYILYMQLSEFIILLNTGRIKDAINQIDDVGSSTIYKM